MLSIKVFLICKKVLGGTAENYGVSSSDYTADWLNTVSVASDRLTTIDESASILSDISYDKTDDSLVSVSLFQYHVEVNLQCGRFVSLSAGDWLSQHCVSLFDKGLKESDHCYYTKVLHCSFELN